MTTILSICLAILVMCILGVLIGAMLKKERVWGTFLVILVMDVFF